MDGFSGTSDTDWVENQKMLKDINRWKRIVSRFRGKLVKMIKDAGSKFDNYLISPKITEILLN